MIKNHEKLLRLISFFQMKLIGGNFLHQNMHKDQITSNLTPRSAYTWIFTPYE